MNVTRFITATGFLVCWILSSLNSVSAPGDVDLSFDAGARVNDFVYAVAAQADGKIIIGGLFTSPRTLLARLNTNGTVDTNFNVGAGANGIIYSIAVQPDGKIVIGGAFSSINGVGRNRIARLNADGSLDLSFDPGTGADGRVRSVALQPSGKVLLAGDFFEVNQAPRPRIARLNADGSLDTTFNPGSGADQEVFCVVSQPDGRVLVGGYFLSINDTPRNYIARLNMDGSVDSSFDPGAGADLDVDSIALQADGKVVIGGGFGAVNGVPRPRIARLNTDGGVDETFDPGEGADLHVSVVVVQSDGKILAAGNFGAMNGIPRNNIARLNTNGSVDAGFNPGNGADAGVYAVVAQGAKIFLGGAFKLFNGATRNHVVRLNADGNVDAGFDSSTGADYPVLAVAQEPSGKVLIGGYFTGIHGASRNYIARLETDGSLDASFNPGLGANNRVLSIAAQPDGKALIGGLFTSFNGTNRSRIARLNPDGNLDLSFNPGSGASADVLSIARQPDGRILIAGEFTSVNGTNRGRIARLNTDGSLDLAFDPGSGANLTVNAITAQPDGKVLVGGDFTSVNGTNRNRIARLNANGSLDLSFNPGSGVNAAVESLAVQPDGKIVIGGQFTSVNGTNRGRLARLNPNGSLDLSFSASADGFVLSVAAYSDGGILVGGDFFSVSGVSRRHIARLNADGSLDASFNPGTGANDSVTTVAVQSDGKALVGGFFNTVNGIGRSSIARLEGHAARPTLVITRSGPNVLTFWPAAFTNFTLQTATNAVQSNGWANVPLTPMLVGGQWTVTNSANQAGGYFRLKSL